SASSASAAGQLEQPSDVNSSTTTGIRGTSPARDTADAAMSRSASDRMGTTMHEARPRLPARPPAARSARLRRRLLLPLVAGAGEQGVEQAHLARVPDHPLHPLPLGGARPPEVRPVQPERGVEHLECEHLELAAAEPGGERQGGAEVAALQRGVLD